MRDYKIETTKDLAKFLNDWAKMMHGFDPGITESNVERLDTERVVVNLQLPSDALSSIRFDLARSVIDRAVASVTSALAASFKKTGLDLQKIMDDLDVSADEPEADSLDEN